MKNSIFLIGITGYIIGACGFVGAVLSKLIIKEEKHFLIVYLLGVGFAVISFFITLKLSEDKFRYVRIEPDDYPAEEDKITIEEIDDISNPNLNNLNAMEGNDNDGQEV